MAVGMAVATVDGTEVVATAGAILACTLAALCSGQDITVLIHTLLTTAHITGPVITHQRSPLPTSSRIKLKLHLNKRLLQALGITVPNRKPTIRM
jgi:hypothetical protein